MGRYWALGLLSVILKMLGVLIFLGYGAFWLLILTGNGNPSTIPVPRGSSSTNLNELDSALVSFAYFWSVVGVFVIFVGWPLLSLMFYAAGQWLDLHIDLTMNTQPRTIAPRVQMPPRQIDKDEQFWMKT